MSFLHRSSHTDSVHGDWRLDNRAVRDRPQGLLRVLVMLIRTNFPALCGGTDPLSGRYGWCYSDDEKAFIV